MPHTSGRGGVRVPTGSRCGYWPLSATNLEFEGWGNLHTRLEVFLKKKKIKKKYLIRSIFCVFMGTGRFAQPCKPPGGEGIRSNKIIAISTNYLDWLFYP